MFYLFATLLAGAWALGFASQKAARVRAQDPGTEKLREIARAIQDGAMALRSRAYRVLGIFVAATNLISGLALGMVSTAWPVVFLCAAILVACSAAGLSGIVEMSKAENEVRERTDKLDAVGNTTTVIGKGFAIGSAALTAWALFSAFQSVADIQTIDVSDPILMSGLLFGAMLPFLFSSMTMRAVGEVA